MTFERYRVSGKQPVVDRLSAALESCGIEIISRPDAKLAPFEYKVKLPSGERIEIVCYAFLANEYKQGGRPPGEHRFQVKYGSEFKRAHEIFIDPNREVVTLFIGVHLEEDIFVAADPAIHNPTWFSSSVEFNIKDIRRVARGGWAGWSRARSEGRRRAGTEVVSCQTEALVGFTAKNMLRYVQFERIATGMDAGERLLLADKMESQEVDREIDHPLEQLYGLSAKEILDVIWRRFRLGVAVRGGVAEYHLARYLRAQPGITAVTDIDEDGRPDFAIVYRDQSLLVECKNVLRSKRDFEVDFQKTRAAKNNFCSRYYDRRSFDILAACLHPITETWEFRFARTSTLYEHQKCPGRLATKVVVAGPNWAPDLPTLLG
jgi:hypothetical protein